MTQPATEAPKPADAAKPAPGASASAPPSTAPGADSAAPDKPGDKAAEPSKPAKAKDHAAVAREQFRLRKMRKELTESTDAKIAEMKAQLDAVVAKAKADGEETARLKAEREEFLSDPISFAEKHGRKPDDVVTGYVKKGTPEAMTEQTRRELAEERTKREALEKKIADAEAQRKKDQDAQAAQQREAQLAGQVNGFVYNVRQQAKKFPYLNSEYSDDEIRAKAVQTQKLALDNGETLSFEDVANAFEKFAQQASEKKAARRAELLTPDEGEPATAAGVQAKPVPGNGRREAHSGPGTSRTTPKPETPKLSRRLTRAEQDAADLAALKAATAKDRAAQK